MSVIARMWQRVCQWVHPHPGSDLNEDGQVMGDGERGAAASLQSLDAAVEERWIAAELATQHARRRLADIVVTLRTIDPATPAPTIDAIRRAQETLQLAIDRQVERLQLARTRLAELRGRLTVVGSTEMMLELEREMADVSAQMEQSLLEAEAVVGRSAVLVDAQAELADLIDAQHPSESEDHC